MAQQSTLFRRLRVDLYYQNVLISTYISGPNQEYERVHFLTESGLGVHVAQSKHVELPPIARFGQ